MSSQPSGGPAIPAAAAVSGLETDEDASAETYDQGEPVGKADAEADERRAAESSDSDSGPDEKFVTADVESQTDQGVPVGRADAEQDRLRASSEDSDG